MVDFLIVGAQKGGTTSLHRYLSAHPEIEMPANKELSFFSNDKYFNLGTEYYENFFKSLNDETIICGEASPQYMYTEIAPQRIAQLYPDVRIIMCLRDPIERAYSHFRMNQRRGKETRSFAQAFDDFLKNPTHNTDDVEFSYFRFGEYGRILEEYLRHFKLDQILFVYSDDLRHNRKAELDNILKFLGKENTIPKDIFETEYHTGGKQRFPALDRAIQGFSKISPKLNSAIKAVVGADRVYALLHKIETQWNIIPEKKNGDTGIEEELRHRICAHYTSDNALFEANSGQPLPWASDTSNER